MKIVKLYYKIKKGEKMPSYLKLSNEIEQQIIEDRKNGYVNEFRCFDEDAIRRNECGKDLSTIVRPAYVRDIEKIMHSPYYNRYADKTQVFSFYRNDDITRRALHVQLVSRIARNIGALLGLNLDLIEAISLGHDIGHTPFGHTGERFLNELYFSNTGRYFNHNVHSVRVLDGIFARNISLWTLEGILCHNGELPRENYSPREKIDFSIYDKEIEMCYTKKKAVDTLVPSTLEACVVRICDMIAYLGKDRQDAIKARLISDDSIFAQGKMGNINAEIINNLVVNIVENSYRKNFIKMDKELYDDLVMAKEENTKFIYFNENIEKIYNEAIHPMFEKIYYCLLKDVREKNVNSLIYKHHIDFVRKNRAHYSNMDYFLEEPNQIVVDYMASMTDDYFVDLHKYMFPKDELKINYVSYFD